MTNRHYFIFSSIYYHCVLFLSLCTVLITVYCYFNILLSVSGRLNNKEGSRARQCARHDRISAPVHTWFAAISLSEKSRENHESTTVCNVILEKSKFFFNSYLNSWPLNENKLKASRSRHVCYTGMRLRRKGAWTMTKVVAWLFLLKVGWKVMTVRKGDPLCDVVRTSGDHRLRDPYN